MREWRLIIVVVVVVVVVVQMLSPRRKVSMCHSLISHAAWVQAVGLRSGFSVKAYKRSLGYELLGLGFGFGFGVV